MMDKNTIQLLNQFMGNLDVEGICGFWVDEEPDENDMIWVYIIIDWDWVNDSPTEPTFIAKRMRLGVKEEIKKFLGVDVMIGSIARKCNELV